MATRRAPTKSRREYGTGSVHQRKSDGRWIGTIEAGWTPDNKRRRVTVSAATEKACRDKLKARQKEVDSGVVTSVSVKVTFKAWSETYLEQTQHKLRPKSWATNRSAIRQWMIPIFGHKRLNQLTPQDVDLMHDAMRAKGKSSTTMNRTQNVLNRMLKDATIAGHRVHPGIVLMDKPAVAKSDRKAMPDPHALAMLAEIEAEPDSSRWVAVILNGMRQGERLGLTWDCVDFDENVIYIRQQLQELPYKDNKNKHLGVRIPDGYQTVPVRGRWHLVPTKTKAGYRAVPMTKWMRASLLAWREVAPPSPHNLVWPDRNGMPIDPDVDRSEWRRMQAQAVILHPTGRSYTVHEGRHTTITLLKGMGVDEKVIALIVGQSKLVQDYVHVDMMPRAREALESLATKLELAA